MMSTNTRKGGPHERPLPRRARRRRLARLRHRTTGLHAARRRPGRRRGARRPRQRDCPRRRRRLSLRALDLVSAAPMGQSARQPLGLAPGRALHEPAASHAPRRRALGVQRPARGRTSGVTAVEVWAVDRLNPAEGMVRSDRMDATADPARPVEAHHQRTPAPGAPGPLLPWLVEREEAVHG